LKAFKNEKLGGDFIALGDYSVLSYCNSHLKLNAQLHRINDVRDFKAGYLNVYDVGLLSESDISIGQISKKTGNASIKYVELGTKLALDGKIDALVTLPINKEAIRQTIDGFSGHTGFLADLCNTSNYTMMLVSEKLIVTHLSTHISLREAISKVKKKRIIDVANLTDAALKKMGRSGKIAIAGLNPHAGENSSFGSEDSEEIEPAVKKLKEEGLDVAGPIAADTVFYSATKGQYDAVVCMYHDQGHIPIKLLDFEAAVNVTLGLPMVRTSVDHGTAFDIAYKGIASTKSLCNAYDLAKKLI
jgi:4-hydroxythreonine-4-phosphate dehydrogenase